MALDGDPHPRRTARGDASQPDVSKPMSHTACQPLGTAGRDHLALSVSDDETLSGHPGSADKVSKSLACYLRLSLAGPDRVAIARKPHSSVGANRRKHGAR